MEASKEKMANCPIKFEEFKIFQKDEGLKQYYDHFLYRNTCYKKRFDEIIKNEGNIEDFARSYKKCGVLPTPSGVLAREWLPQAKEVYLTGDFCNWDPKKFRYTKKDFGWWELVIPPDEKGNLLIPHGSKIKINVHDCNGKWGLKIPA